MAARRSILVFEYLLADCHAWSAASDSMQREAFAMLMAIVNDLEQFDEFRPVVLMSSGPATQLRSSGNIGSNTEVIVCDDGPSEWLRQPDRPTSTFAATLVIAPECDGLLVSLLQQLQCDPWQDVLNLNVPWSMAEIFADKLRTRLWLESNGLATPPTKTLNDDAAGELRSKSEALSFERPCALQVICSQSTEFAVIKPRDGVGSDRVSLVPMSHDAFQRLPESCGEHDRWVIQPFVRGTACSIGFLGGGATDATLILPPAEQDIQWVNGRLQYCGGRIPCDPSLEPAVKSVADRLTQALGPFHGYLGADIVVNPDSPQDVNAYVIEINPRLCTSYVGYRTFAAENLAARFVPGGSQRPVLWKTSGVQFCVDGEIGEKNA